MPETDATLSSTERYHVTIWLRSHPVPIELDCEEFAVTVAENPLNGTRLSGYEWKSGPEASQSLLWLEPAEIIAVLSELRS